MTLNQLFRISRGPYRRFFHVLNSHGDLNSELPESAANNFSDFGNCGILGTYITSSQG